LQRFARARRGNIRGSPRRVCPRHERSPSSGSMSDRAERHSARDSRPSCRVLRLVQETKGPCPIDADSGSAGGGQGSGSQQRPRRPRQRRVSEVEGTSSVTSTGTLGLRRCTARKDQGQATCHECRLDRVTLASHVLMLTAAAVVEGAGTSSPLSRSPSM